MIQCTKGQLSQADWGPWEAELHCRPKHVYVICPPKPRRGCLPKSVTSKKDCTTAYSENIMSLRTGESEPSPTKVTSIHHSKNTYLRRKVQPWADHPCRESSHGKYGWLPQLPQWISVDVASLWLGISCVYYLQLLPCRYWTQWSPNVMILCHHSHASLYLLPDILSAPHSLTRDWTHGHSRMAL